MKFKNSRCSWPLWFVFAGVLCLCFAKTTAALTSMLQLQVLHYFILTAGLLFAALLCIYLPVRVLVSNRRPKSPAKGSGRYPVLETGSLVLLLAALFCVRFFLAPAMLPGSGQPGFDAAEVADPALGTAGLLAGELYIWLLSTVFAVFGADGMAVFWVNLLLQLIGAVCLWYSVRFLSNGFVAGCVLLSVSILPLWVESTYVADARSLLLCLMGVLFLMVCCCFKLFRRSRSHAGILLMLLFTGFLCGAACYSSVLLGSVGLLLLYGVFCLKTGRVKKRTGLYLAETLAGLGLGFMAMLLGHAFLAGGISSGSEQLLRLAVAWPVQTLNCDLDVMLHGTGLHDYIAVLPLCLFAFFLLFGRSEEQYDPVEMFILPFVFVVAMETLADRTLPEQGIRFLYLSIFAGAGLRQMCCPVQQEKAEPSAEGGRLEEGKREKQMLLKRKKNSPAEDDKEPLHGNLSQEQQRKEQPAEKKFQKAAPGEYLANPLPVPKRHVKRDMEYSFEPGEDQLFYDVAVSDDDDFDLRE